MNNQNQNNPDLVNPDELAEILHCGRRKAFKTAKEIGAAFYNEQGHPLVLREDITIYLRKNRNKIREINNIGRKFNRSRSSNSNKQTSQAEFKIDDENYDENGNKRNSSCREILRKHLNGENVNS